MSTSALTEQNQPADFVDRDSVVRRIWGDANMVLLIFAGSAAEFALNRAVDWLFFTGKLPRDPIGRLFSTAGYSQQIVFADVSTASRTLERIRAVHHGVERQRGQAIPDWAHRDVLYMLIDYSERAHQLLARPLTRTEQHDLYEVFYRVGAGLRIPGLPQNYTAWKADRDRHLRRDLIHSNGTKELLAQYRNHLGGWRYSLLLRIQAILTPDHVRCLLGLHPAEWLRPLFRAYPFLMRARLSSIIQRLLMPSKYLSTVRGLNYAGTTRSEHTHNDIHKGKSMARMRRHVKWSLLLALAISAWATRGTAQEWRLLDAGAAYLGAGISAIGTGELEERLAARGYPTFGRTAAGVNLGAHVILPGRVTLGGEWHGLIIGDAVHEGRPVGIGGGYGTIGIGYVVELSPRARIYPRLGFGGGGLGLWFESDSLVSFDDVLADPKPTPNPSRQPVLSRNSVVMDVGVGAELLPGGWGRGLMVGLRLGYLAAPSSAKWQLREHDVTGGPAVTLAGPYIRAVFGVGRRR